MPITGGGSLLAAARLAAEDAVKTRWRALNRQLSPSEIAQMRLEMKEADSSAILAFLTVNVVVAVSGPGGPATGVIS